MKKAAKLSAIQDDYMPNTIIADNAPAIHNGFNAVFGEAYKRINCWAHAIRNIDEELAKIKDKEVRSQMRSDICKIQLSQNENLFLKATELFTRKWNNKETEFVNYFNENWCQTKNGWYEGYSVGDPSQSNAIES